MPNYRKGKNHGLYFHSSPPKVLPMNNQVSSKPGHDQTKEAIIIKPSNIRIWIHDKDIAKLTKVLWEGQGMRLRSENCANQKVKKFLDATPYILNVIKDVHSAAADNDLEFLKSKTAPPVPPELLSSKDANGLTALHKAAGLAHTRLVEYLLSVWPNAATERDATGKLPLHWAASAKNNDRCFNLLVQAGADETATDNKMKTAAYYKQKPNDIDRSLLTIIPEAPRIPNMSPAIDWSILSDVAKNSQQNNVTSHKNSLSFIADNNNSFLDNQINPLRETSFTRSRNGSLLPNFITDNIDNTPEIASPEMLDMNGLNNNGEIKILSTEEEAVLAAISDKPTRKLRQTAMLAASNYENHQNILNRNLNGNQGDDYDTAVEEKNKKNVSEIYDLEGNAMIIGNGNENNTSTDQDDNKQRFNEEDNTNEEAVNYTNNDAEPNDDYHANGNDDENNNDVENNEEIGNGYISNNENYHDKDDEAVNENGDNDDDDDDDDDQDFEGIMLGGSGNAGSGREHYHHYMGQEENNKDNDERPRNIKSALNGIADEIELDYDPSYEGVVDIQSMVNDRTRFHDEDKDDDDDAGNDKNGTEQKSTKSSSKSMKSRKSVASGVSNGVDNGQNGSENVESPSPALEIEGVVRGEPDNGQLQSQGGVMAEEIEDSKIQSIIDSGDMEQLAAIVLNGEGNKLVGMQSDQPEIQAFLDNVTAYMNKIRRVHLASREGNLRDLQSALDRRKFAIAKDEVSPHGATPLHVATIFGHAGIVRYLAGRFPETTNAVDDNKRTALHYAATLSDNGHFYNLLVHLGANSKAIDDIGNTAEFYMNHINYADSSEILSHKQLLRDYGVQEELADEMLHDQVPDDVHSARRPVDDADIMSTLERCYKIIHEHRKPVQSHSVIMNSVPGSSSSARVSVVNNLSRFLKRGIFDKIKHRQTKLDHNLFDLIWPAMKKAKKERLIDEDLNAGVVIPDFDVYVVFQEFLIPLIKDMHCLDLQRDLVYHPETEFLPPVKSDSDRAKSTIRSDISIDESLNEIHMNLDTSGKWIKFGVVESSRNLNDFELPLNLNIGQLEQAERVLTGKLLTLNFAQAIGETELGMYFTMNEILENPSEIRTVLATFGLLVPVLDVNDPQQLPESVAINGHYWPYGRGVFVSHKNDFVAWINVQDHLRILCCSPSSAVGDIGAAYSKVGRAITYLEEKIHFRRSYYLGNLSSRPSFLGTSLRLTYVIDLPNLMKENDNLTYLCSVRGLHLGKVKTSNAVKLSNKQSMGVIEWKIFIDYCTAVANILQLEKDLGFSNTKQIASMLINIFRKKKHSLIEMSN